jgi:hypothetical protein
MTYDQLKAFLEANPKFNQTFRMNVVDPVGIGVTKPPSDFQKYVLGKVAAAPLARRHLLLIVDGVVRESGKI